MKHIDAASTAAALGFGPLISALENMFASGCEVPVRHSHQVGADLTMLLMPAWQAGRYLGIKTVNIAPGNSTLGLPGLFSTYLLFDATTGEPLAQIDGNEITSRRTAAASALAASRLASPDSRTLLVVGTGRVGSLLPRAYRAVLPITRILVWDRDAPAATAMVARLRNDGMSASVVTDLAEAASSADIVSCATLATEPLISGEWLSPGSHLDLIGSFTPGMREACDDCFSGAEVWVDTREALLKSGCLLHAMASGALVESQIHGTLADLCVRSMTAYSPTGRTVFKSVGTALADLAAAILVYNSEFHQRGDTRAAAPPSR